MASTSSNILKDLAWSSTHQCEQKSSAKTLKKLFVIPDTLHTKIKAAFSRLKDKIIYKKAADCNNTSETAQRNRFIEAVKRIEFNYAFSPTISNEAPFGYFRGRAIIGKDSAVHGGIFVGAVPHEALVVDEKYGALEKIIITLIGRISQLDQSNANYEYDVFAKTIALTRELLRFSEEGVQQVLERYRIMPDEKVTLDLFIQKKVGVARHQVLLAAFLLEKLNSKGLIRGMPAIDSHISDDIPQERLIFTSSEGEIFRFDPTKGLGKTAIH